MLAEIFRVELSLHLKEKNSLSSRFSLAVSTLAPDLSFEYYFTMSLPFAKITTVLQSSNKCARVQANQPISALHFFNPQQMFLVRVKLITQGEKRETSTKTCNEAMLRDKLRVFVSRLSPPLVGTYSLPARRVARVRGAIVPVVSYGILIKRVNYSP